MARLSFAKHVRFSTLNDTTYTGLYVVPVNPLKYKKPRMEGTQRINTLDGPGGYQHPHYNGIIHEMQWGFLPASSAYHDMVTMFRSYRGKKLYILEGSAGTDRNEIWKPIIVINVEVEYDNAPNTQYYYKAVVLKFALLSNAEFSIANWTTFATADSPWEPPPTVPAGRRELLSEIPDPDI